MATIIETQALTHRFGKVTALDSLELAIEEGSIYGFVGPNGAGKTTTIRVLATLLRPTAGQAWVGGHSVTAASRAVRQLIGYMPDFFGVYGDMTVAEYLDFFAACYGIRADTRGSLTDDLLQLVELSHRRDSFVDTLSRGMQQRLCLARALIHDPQVLILDEPASGLDPRARIEIRELLRELHAMGKTIFLSSHILSEVEEICTHIGIIEEGRLVATGSLAEMRERIRQHRTVRIGLVGAAEPARLWLADQPGVLEVRPLPQNADGDLELEFVGDDQALAGLLASLIGAGFRPTLFHEKAGDLEDIFMRLTRGAVS